MPRPQDPTIAYLVHRGVLIGMVSVLLLATGYLIVLWLPGMAAWVASAIEATHDEWRSWF